MSRRILSSHVREGSYRRSFLLSVVAHAFVLAFFLLAVDFFPQTLIELGSGQGGGQGADIIPVGLTADLGGGEGMVKPSLTPVPEAVPPEVKKPEVKEKEPITPPEKPQFVEKKPDKTTKTARKPPAGKEEKPATQKPEKPRPIPRAPEAGSGGPGGAGAGAGGGFGGGQGVEIGSGSGAQGEVDSWYVRQVERRIGENWLKTSLGQLDRPVLTVISFEVIRDGKIQNITLEKRSGIDAVDLAAERAVRASTPLPPLPYELQRSRIRFIANFRYPPR